MHNNLSEFLQLCHAVYSVADPGEAWGMPLPPLLRWQYNADQFKADSTAA